MKAVFYHRALTYLIATTSVALPTISRADAVREVGLDRERQIIRMNVTPADAPTPAFRFRLTLLPHETRPGNSVVHYLRAFVESDVAETWRHFEKKLGDEFSAWYADEVSIDELPLEQMDQAVRALGHFVENYVEPGSRCRETDWGLAYEELKAAEFFRFLIPEVQGMRWLSRATSLLTRHAIAERRYDDALDLLRMNYRLGRDVNKQPILVSGLVGVAIASVANGNMVDLIAAPDSPNLYWALTELPTPLTTLREALRLELAIGPRLFDISNETSGKERTQSAWNALWRQKVTEFDEVVGWTHPAPPTDVSRDFLPLALGLAGYAHAKERLIASGHETDRVNKMATGQVLLTYSILANQAIANEYEKVAYFDPATSRRLMRQVSEMESSLEASNRGIVPIAKTLLPAVVAAQTATFRVQREIDAIRVIEALRMHAAQNDRQWPATLEEITCVPVPTNVLTGKPFNYHVEGGTAVLLLPYSDGVHREHRYEITLTTNEE